MVRFLIPSVFIWASSYFDTSHNQTLNMHAQPSNGARGLKFGSSPHLGPFFSSPSSEG